jgi:hypothetical protein
MKQKMNYNERNTSYATKRTCRVRSEADGLLQPLETAFGQIYTMEDI